MFKVGDKVITTKDTRDYPAGLTGSIVAVRTNGALYPYQVCFDDSKSELYTEIEISLIQGPDRVTFTGGGMRDTQAGKPRFDLLMPLDVPFEDQFLTRCAHHMAKGAEKYEDRNWEKFNDQEALDRAKASALRHIHQWASGETDEDHAAAVFFNLMAAEYVKDRLS